MEVKCKVCGTINDSNNAFCKGCFLPLHKTMQEWTKDIEDKINDKLEPIEELKPKEEVSLDETTLLPIIESEESEQNEIEEVIIPDKIDEIEQKEDTNLVTPPTKPVEPTTLEDINVKTFDDIKPVDDIKQELKCVEIVKDDEEKTNLNEKTALELTIKFDLILIVLSLIFTYFTGFKVEEVNTLLYGALSTILLSAISIFLTFKTKLPKESDINKTHVLIFVTMAIFEIIFRNWILYNSEFNLLYIYVFTTLLYLLITIMIVNAISRFVRKNKNEFEPSKFVSRMNTIVLILVVILAIVGVIVKNQNTSINTNSNSIIYAVPEELVTYIESINNKIVENINNDENYEIPEAITDPEFVDNSIGVESVSLTIDEYGTVKSGEIKYNKVTYRYKDGTFLAG